MERTLGCVSDAWNIMARGDQAWSYVEREYELFLTRDQIAASPAMSSRCYPQEPRSGPAEICRGNSL